MSDTGEYLWTPLATAVWKGDVESVREIVKTTNVDVDERVEGWPPIVLAAAKGYTNCVMELLRLGADINNFVWCKEGQDVGTFGGFDLKTFNGSTAIYMASHEGHEKTLEFLISKGADIDQKKKNGSTPIFGAAYRGHEKIVNMLIDAGCDARSARPDGVTAASLAAQEGHAVVLQSLVRGNADVNIPRDDGATPVYMAARNGCAKTVKVLIDSGADVCVSMKGESEGASPIYIASQLGHTEALYLLIRAGADINASIVSGFSPLFVASQEGHLEVLRTLINSGADVNFVNRSTRYCDSPITIAAYFGQVKAVSILLGAGANPKHVTADNRTCESMLMERHQAKLPSPSVEGLGWTQGRHYMFSSQHKKIVMILFRMCTMSPISLEKMEEDDEDEVLTEQKAHFIPLYIWLDIMRYTFCGWFQGGKRTSKITGNDSVEVARRV